jgi:hypothetical protein
MKELIRHILREHTREIGEMKKITTPEFIERAKSVHGNKYDYSKVDYKGATNKVEIICPIHGEFLQTAYEHAKGSGCPNCAGNIKKTTPEFIKNAIKIHGDKFDYSKVKYKNANTPIKIICPIHGEFSQEPTNHLSGKGCPKCGGTGKLNKQEFIKKSKEIHGDKYDYSKVDYKNTRDKIRIICPLHGEFLQSPGNHIIGQECPICGRKKANDKHKIGTEKFINRAIDVHGNKYDYSQVDYIGNHKKIKIICPTHGEFFQEPSSHLSGAGCPKCSGVAKSNTNEFIKRAKEIHGDKYDYSQVDYKRRGSPVIIKCTKHGEFSQQPANHLSGQGCPYCQESKGENLLVKLLNNNDIKFVRQKVFDDCKSGKEKYCRKLPFDFYLPENNSILEYDGRQHFEPVWGEDNLRRTKQLDKIKNQYCKKNGIKLIRIPYTMKKEEIEPYILKELGIK